MMYFAEPFATSGDKTTVPEATQPDGSVSYEQGFPVKYSTPVASGGLDVPRASFNELFYEITLALQQYQENGIPDYFAAISAGAGYSKDAMVLYSGDAYISLVNSNTALPGSDPAKWSTLSARWLPTTGGTITGTTAMSGASFNFAAPVTVTISGGTLNLGSAASNNCTTSGGGSVTSLGTAAAGVWRVVNVNSVFSITVGGSIAGPQTGTLSNSIVTQIGDYFLAVSTGSGNWRVIYFPISGAPAGGYCRGFRNFAASYSSNTTFAISASEALTYDATYGLTRPIRNASVTVNCATTGANGLDAGSLANNTWYYGYLILNPSTSTIAGLASTSATAPTLPSGYTFATKACTAFRTDGSATIIGFKQAGTDYQYVVGSNLSTSRLMASGAAGSTSTPTYVSVATGNFVPSIASKIQLFLQQATNVCIAAPNNSYGAAASATNPPPVNAAAASVSYGDFVLESSNIYWASDGNAYLYCLGFTVNL